jgi:hypothetical protein
MQFNPTTAVELMTRPSRLERESTLGSPPEVIWSQHCTEPMLHSLEPPLATGLAETATLLVIVKAAM